MRYITLLILTFLSITSYAQTIINVDSSNTVNIYNNGTLIENNQGTVNIGTEIGKDEELRMPDDLGKVTEPKDRNVHFIYTDDYKFAGDKVKIKGKVYKNVNIWKALSGERLFKLIGNEAYDMPNNSSKLIIKGYHHYFSNGYLYVSKFKNCNDDYFKYKVADNYSGRKSLVVQVDLIDDVVVSESDYSPWEIFGYMFIWAFILILPALGLQDVVLDQFDHEWPAWVIYLAMITILGYACSNC